MNNATLLDRCLDSVESCNSGGGVDLIKDLKAAIAEQAKQQEPIAYQNSGGIDVITARVRELMSNPRAGSIANNAAKRYTTALYTRPQSLEPMSDADIGLTIDAIDFSQMVTADDYQYLIARAIEAKLGVKK